MIRYLILAGAALSLSACGGLGGMLVPQGAVESSGALQTILTATQRVDDAIIARTQQAIDTYCAAYTPQQRDAIRQRVNADRNNQVLIDCPPVVVASEKKSPAG